MEILAALAAAMAATEAGRGSSGFGSDWLLAERRGHPLPLPVNTVVAVVDVPGGCESGFASVSSLSSWCFSEEQFGADRHHFGLNSGYGDESSPHSLSQWKKGKLLGKGAFGNVYLGFNSDTGHMCAIKEVKVVQDDQDSECLKQLNQEIYLLSKLSHPNIVRYYGSEMCEETLSVYLEYVSGGSIHKLLQEFGAFKEPVIQKYAWQIVSGLVYLHGENTLHRDIKGANILVDPSGDVKLADFGIAKHITSASTILSFKGSSYWMAPEVVKNASSCNFAVDIWSLGCTILEMATGKPPWSQHEPVAAIFKIGNGREMPEIPDNLSSDAKSFINLCLQRDPSRRPTALQMLGHPFIYEQGTIREANVKIPRDAVEGTSQQKVQNGEFICHICKKPGHMKRN